MARRFYSVMVGENQNSEVTEQDTDPAEDIVIAIDMDTNYPSRLQVLNAINLLTDFILTDNWPAV